MLIVKVYMRPFGDEASEYLLAQATIVNDGLGTQKVGDYNIKFSQQNNSGGKFHVWKRVRVTNFPRLSKNIWNLLYRALKEAYE